jgi:hypothetical protein
MNRQTSVHSGGDSSERQETAQPRSSILTGYRRPKNPPCAAEAGRTAASYLSREPNVSLQEPRTPGATPARQTGRVRHLRTEISTTRSTGAAGHHPPPSCRCDPLHDKGMTRSFQTGVSESQAIDGRHEPGPLSPTALERAELMLEEPAPTRVRGDVPETGARHCLNSLWHNTIGAGGTRTFLATNP